MPEFEYLYGLNPGFEVLRAGRRTVSKVFLQAGSESSPRIRKLISLLQSRKIACESVSKGRLFELCRSTEHQGVVIQTSPYPYEPFEALLDSPRLLLLDNVEDPQNVGAILRSAEIFGWPAVLLSARGVPGIYPSVVKAAAGATEYLRIAHDHTANAYVRALLEKDFMVVALDENGPEDLLTFQHPPPAKLLLVIGGEHRSVGQFILNAAQHVVRIPQRGQITSLNASVAAGIALFQLGAVTSVAAN